MTRILILALFAVAFAARAVAQPVEMQLLVRNGVPVAPEDQLERWFFANDGSAEAARRRLESQLKVQIDWIDRVAKLTPDQKAKLATIGRGDMKRLFDTIEAAKRRYQSLANDANRLGVVQQELLPVQTAMQFNPFDGGSLFAKSLRNTLTPEQFAAYDAAVSERQRLRNRATVESAVVVIERVVPLSNEQRKRLIDLMASEIKPARATGTYATYWLIASLGELPDEKVKPLFSQAELLALRKLTTRYGPAVANLRQRGFIVVDGEEDADNGPKP